MRILTFLPALFAAALVASVALANAATGTSSATIPSNTTVPITILIPGITTLSSALVVTQGLTGKDFTDAGGGTCIAGSSYSAGASCTVMVHFTPSTPGTHYGAVVLKDSSPGSQTIATVYLQGSIQAPQLGIAGAPARPIGTVPIYPYWEGYNSSPNYSYGALAFDPAGNIYIGSEAGSASKWTLNPDGSYTGSNFNPGNGASGPGIAIDGAGNIYVACGASICKETPDYAGSYSPSTVISGLNYIFGLAVDGSGNIYATDSPQDPYHGAVTLYKWTLQSDGSYVQSTIDSGLADAGPVTVDPAGNVYTTDVSPFYFRETSTLYKEIPSSNGYTLTVLDSTLVMPVSLALDRADNIYVADSLYFMNLPSYEKCEEGASGSSGLIEEMPQTGGGYLSSINNHFYTPNVIAFDNAGNQYVVDTIVSPRCYGANSTLYKTQVDITTPPTVSFGSIPHGTITKPQTIAFTNSGNAPLKFRSFIFSQHFIKAASAAGDCAVGSLLAPGANCNVSFAFHATTPLSNALSATYQEPITISSNSVTNSQVSIQVVGTEIATIVHTPIFSLAAGTYPSAQSVTVADSSPGASIYYTTDGTVPTDLSAKYTGSIHVAATETLTAIACAAGDYPSAPASARYIIPQAAALPQFSVPTGIYSGQQTVTITDSTPGATIYYTANGTTPTSTASEKYTGPITIKNTDTLKAIAASVPAYFAGPVASATYTLVAATPVVSPVGGSFTGPQTITITSATQGAKIYYTTNGKTPNGNSTRYTGPITINTSKTIKAIAAATGYTTSTAAVSTYTIH